MLEMLPLAAAFTQPSLPLSKLEYRSAAGKLDHHIAAPFLRHGKRITDARCTMVCNDADAGSSCRKCISKPLCEAARSGTLSEVQWLLSLVPSGSDLEALKAVALAQAAVSSRGATCKWLLDTGANSNIYVLRRDRINDILDTSYMREALVAYVYRQDGAKGDRQWYPFVIGSSPVFVDLVEMLLPKASSDMAAMWDLAKAVSKQADAASLQMLVAQLPDSSGTTFINGQTMLHVVVRAANNHLESILKPYDKLRHDPRKTFCEDAKGVSSRSRWYSEPTDFSYWKECPARCGICTTQTRRHKEYFKACLKSLLDLGICVATMDNDHNSALTLCSEHFREGRLLLMEALQAQLSNAPAPQASDDVKECSICMQENADCVLVPCGHLCVCHCCATRLQGVCPICRASISQVVRVYHT